MSRRLIAKIAKAARRSARGYQAPSFPVGAFKEFSPYPSAKVPDSEREIVTKRLHNGAILTTYVDTLASVKRRQWTPPPEPEKEPEGAVKGPPAVPKAAKPNGPEEPSPYADWTMPGHPKKGIVSGAKL